MRRNWKRILSALCVFAMVLSNIPANLFAVNRAVLAEDTTGVPVSGHQHTEACYQQLVCELEESEDEEVLIHRRFVKTFPIHHHTEACFVEGRLACGYLEEGYVHQHNQYCYDENGALICGLVQKTLADVQDDQYEAAELQSLLAQNHHHTEACWAEDQKHVVCGMIEVPEWICTKNDVFDQVETIPGHHHTEACYQHTVDPICGLAEQVDVQSGSEEQEEANLPENQLPENGENPEENETVKIDSPEDLNVGDEEQDNVSEEPQQNEQGDDPSQNPDEPGDDRADEPGDQNGTNENPSVETVTENSAETDEPTDQITEGQGQSETEAPTGMETETPAETEPEVPAGTETDAPIETETDELTETETPTATVKPTPKPDDGPTPMPSVKVTEAPTEAPSAETEETDETEETVTPAPSSEDASSEAPSGDPVTEPPVPEEGETPAATETEEITEVPETEQPVVFEAGTLTVQQDEYMIQLAYGAEACIPKDANALLSPVGGRELEEDTALVEQALNEQQGDSPWKMLVQNATFLKLALYDESGERIIPAADVQLTIGMAEDVRQDLFFALSEEPVLATDQNTFVIDAYAGETFGFADIGKKQTGPVTLEYRGKDFKVIASFGPEAGFPADVQLKAVDITNNTTRNNYYSKKADALLEENWQETAEFKRILDIFFYAEEEGNQLEPQAPIDVQVIFDDLIELPEENDLQAIHISNGKAEMISAEAQSNEAAANVADAVDTVAFTSDSFSVYMFMTTAKISEKVRTADGKTYSISVTYGEDAMIPNDAQVVAREIPAGSEQYELYRAHAAAALNAEYLEGVAVPGLFDIHLEDQEGNRINPEAGVKVSIRLDEGIEESKDIQVLHFKETPPDILTTGPEKDDTPSEANPSREEQTEVQSSEAAPTPVDDAVTKELLEKGSIEVISSASVEGDQVTFQTDGFSVYAIAYTVDFHYNGIDYSIPGESQILLSELIEKLQIMNGDELLNVKDVDSVSFTDAHLVTVQKVSGLITYNDAEGVDVGDADFLLTSEQPFTSEENLSIKINNGDII